MEIRKVDSSGIQFQGRGRNECIRVYLYPCKGEWTSILENSEGETREANLITGRILYFKLKSSQKITIKCSTKGKLKVL